MAAARPFGSIPLTVLTSAADYRQNVSSDTTVKQTMGWRAGHVVLSSRSTRGKVVLVQGSNHSIQLSRPDAVVAAVQEVVQGARASARVEQPMSSEKIGALSDQQADLPNVRPGS